MLQELGHNILEAYSAKEALGTLAEHDVDLLITDQGMPGMTGAELIAAARCQRSSLRALLATGYAELAPGTATGVPRLGKPFSTSELAHAVAAATRAD